MSSEILKKEIIEQLLDSWVPSGNWTWNDDGTVDVNGNVFTPWESKFKKFPVKFKKVSGFFDCSENDLETLENCPDEIGKMFKCSYNKIENLNGCPKKVVGNFYLNENIRKFTPEEISEVCEVSGKIIV